ncbi:MAG: hypothetical protein ACJ73E_16155, partial [Mycobacteriales bacterium]
GRAEPAVPAWRRGPLPAVLLAVTLLLTGVLLGGWLTRGDPPAPGPQPTAGGPPPREPPPPPSGASRRATGLPTVDVNQPHGDGDTTFVVYGRGWAPGIPVTVTLIGHPSSPDRPVVDRAGAFNYTVNQRHEFFPGRLPVATHTVVVTAPGGRTEQVSFQVDH